jgi:regulator of cell morphogenesis and NO signaling
MAEVVEHILKVHHTYVYQQLDLIEELLEEGARSGEPPPPDVSFLRGFFPNMALDLRVHMREEEEKVFPYLLDAERAMERGAPIPHPFRGYSSLTHPILTLQADHGMMGREWKKLEELTHHFTPEPGAGRVLKDLYQALRKLEMDNRKHMHLENNVLFHRAEQLGLVNGGHMSHHH